MNVLMDLESLPPSDTDITLDEYRPPSPTSSSEPLSKKISLDDILRDLSVPYSGGCGVQPDEDCLCGDLASAIENLVMCVYRMSYVISAIHVWCVARSTL